MGRADEDAHRLPSLCPSHSLSFSTHLTHPPPLATPTHLLIKVHEFLVRKFQRLHHRQNNVPVTMADVRHKTVNTVHCVEGYTTLALGWEEGRGKGRGGNRRRVEIDVARNCDREVVHIQNTCTKENNISFQNVCIGTTLSRGCNAVKRATTSAVSPCRHAMCVDCHAQLTLQAAGWPPDLQRGEGPEEVALLQKLLNKTNDTKEQRENAVRALRTYSPSTAFCSNAMRPLTPRSQFQPTPFSLLPTKRHSARMVKHN